MGCFRRVAWLLVVVCAGAGVSAQVLSPNAANVPEYTLSGVVVNSVTGEALRRALVEVYASEPHAMLTEPDGRFSFSDLPAGNYSLQVRKPGFFREQDLSQQFRSMNVVLGPDTKPITVKLMPEAVISGTVTDQDGLPVPRFAVRVMRRDIIEGRGQWSAGHQLVGTDEYGQFRVGGLAPGTYAVSVGPSRQPVPPVGNTSGKMNDTLFGYRQTYFPNAPDLSSAAMIQARPGQRVETNFTLTAEPFYTVKGAVIGGIGNVDVLLQDSGRRVPMGRVDQATGTFENKFVPPGNYVLEAMSGDNALGMLTATMPLVVNRELVNVRVALQRTITIPVEVEERHVSTRQTLQGVVSTGGNRVPPVSVALIPREEPFFGGPETTYNKNSITLNKVFPGKYPVRADAQPPWYVESMSHEGVDLLTEELTVTVSAAQQPIEVVVRDDGATLRVSLKSDVPEEGVLLLVPDRARTRVQQYPISSQGGAYIPPLKPGSYTLLAFDDVSGLEYSKPEVLEPFLSKALRVTLNADEESTVKVDIVRRRSE